MVVCAESPSFSYALGFDRPAAAGLPSRPDGSMAGMIWGAGTQMHSGYNFGYDPMRQMTDAECTLWKPITSIETGKPESRMTGSGARWDLTPAGSWKRQPGRREGGITYDANGNILSVVRTDADGNPLHELEYRYDGNRLHSIELNGGEPVSYRYDANGNMTYDGLRDVEIQYNHLNLPERIFAGSDEIRYIYSSDGRKLASVADGSFTYYRSVMVYGRSAETGGEELLYMLQPEGLAVKNSAGEWTYKYSKCDHLGNVRVLLAAVPGTDGVELIEEQRTDYYPFGLAWEYANLHLNRYLYNGKELQDASVGRLGLLELYDFGARYYDPMLGRWFNVDPALQLMNPYLFCANAPMIYTDPNGEFLGLAIGLGALFGAYMGGVKANGSWNPFEWDWSWDSIANMFAGAVTGAISGGIGASAGIAVGAALPSAVSAGTFIGNGMVTGMVSGLASGFVGGGMNAMMYGGNIFESALSGGASGGFMGGMTGAASGAAKYSKLKNLFLSIESSKESTGDNLLTASNETLKTFNDTYFSKVKYYNVTEHIYDHEAVYSRNPSAYAHTLAKPVNGKYIVKYADGAFSDKLTLWLTMGHEYVHVSQFASGIPGNSIELFEGGAYQWQKNILQKHGLVNHEFYTRANNIVNTYGQTIPNYLVKSKPYMPRYDWNIPRSIPATLLY